MNKKQIEKIAKAVKSDKEFKATIEKFRIEERKNTVNNLIKTAKIAGIVCAAIVIAVVTIGIINNVDFQSNASVNTVRAIIKTTKGDVILELNKDAAPRTVANFINNAKNGFYNNSFFNRIIKDGILEGGVPQTGISIQGQPAAARPGIKDSMDYEITNLTHEKWSVAMAAIGGKASKSMFYICLSPQQKLDGKGLVFAKVVDGFDVVTKLTDVKLIKQVTDNEIIKDDKGNPIKNQEHNGMLYQVANDEVSRAEDEESVRIKEVQIIE
jgi:cyclophilin family peptidyl-prolyl cis-trans isomerase